MLTLNWVQMQIEEAVNGQNTPQNVRDFALLCIARDNLMAMQEDKPKADSKAMAVEVVNQSANLNAVPTIKQANNAMSAALGGVVSKAEKQKAKDLNTWAKILKG